ncbi:MAG: hypothetical protein JO250_11110 [Armatimonadetes bacterium]|nr:hypothetical protein [Armatimonadota bacterium]
MAFKVNDLMIQLPGQPGGGGGGCGLDTCGIDTCNRVGLTIACDVGVGLTHCGGDVGVTCGATCAVAGLTNCGPCSFAASVCGPCSHAVTCAGCSAAISACHPAAVSHCGGCSIIISVCAASLCNACSHAVTHCGIVGASHCGGCSVAVSVCGACSHLASVCGGCSVIASIRPCGCSVVASIPAPVNPGDPVELDQLKAQLQQALANVEKQQQATNEALKPQTLEQVDQLEQQIKGALDELSNRRAELQQKTAGQGGGDTNQGTSEKKPGA